MALFSATATRNGKANQTWCICRLCVDGFGIPVEIDGEEYRVCGELCAVGQPMSKIDILSVSTASTSTASTMASKVTAPSPLVCNICRVEVDLSSSLSKPCVSDDDDMISSNN